MKFIQYAISKQKNTNNKKNLSGKIIVRKKHFFFLRSSNTSHSFTFNLQFFYELKHKVHHFSESLCGISIFYSAFFHKVYLYFEGATKTANLFKKGFFLNWNLLHARLNSHNKARSYKKKIKAQKV